MHPSRRDFLKASATTLATAATFANSPRLYAQPLRLPLGLQLYSVRELLPKDYAGTLKQIGALGYKEVESAGYYHHSAPEVTAAVQDAGLKLVSAHYSSDALHKDFDQILAFEHSLGTANLICSFPGKDPARLAKATPAEAQKFTLDDFKWNAAEFNKFGEKTAAAGIKFGYHNHTVEFRSTDGTVPFVELMRLTDPAHVTVEMDCGWVMVGGGNPIELLQSFPTRISMLHVKDFQSLPKAGESGEPHPVELGHGVIDYRPILAAAAKTGHIQHVFVEQEAFTVPPMESLKIDADYMRKLGAA
jgi:sugar phosphate isomerase/epimerase